MGCKDTIFCVKNTIVNGKKEYVRLTYSFFFISRY